MTSFVLKGPDSEEEIRVHFVALLRELPGIERSEFIILVGEDEGFTRDKVGNVLIDLAGSLNLGTGKNPLEKNPDFDRASKVLAEANTPFIMLEVGKSDRTKQEMAILHVANGLTVETGIKALLDMNKKAELIARQN